MSRACKLLLPDAGPLISLGKINALDLLLLPNMDIVVVDAVLAETTFDKKFPEAQIIEAFVDEYATVKTTQEGRALLAALHSKSARPRHAGDFSMLRFLLSQSTAKSPCLVLFEDSDILKQIRVAETLAAQREDRPMTTHYLSMAGFLVGLEKLGLIPSAASYIAAMENAGRVIKDKTHPLDIPGDGPSTWEPRP